jgi:anti-sigma B factor antagonist
MEPQGSFHYEVEKLPDDQRGNKVTTVKCHGRLTIENAARLKEVVKPLLAAGGRTIIDLSDVSFLDSSGLGALISLKVSAVNQGLCILEFANMTPRVLELLRVTRLMQILTS